MVVKTTKRNLAVAASGLALCLACTMASAAPSKQRVFAVQNALHGAGYSIANADGKVDASTQQALKAYQQKHNLKVTGEIDDQTMIKLGVKVDSNTTADAQVQTQLASYGIGSAPPQANSEAKAQPEKTQSKPEASAAKPEKKQAPKNEEKKKKKKKGSWWFW